MMKDIQTKTWKDYSKLARKIWLDARHVNDIQKAKEYYNEALNLLKIDMNESSSSNGIHDNGDDNDDNHNDIQCEIRNIQEKIALIQYQTNESNMADDTLKDLGYICRLSNHVLNYQYESNTTNTNVTVSDTNTTTTTTTTTTMMMMKPTCPCLIVDDFLSSFDQERLSNIFSNIESSYWKDHSYVIEPPSPYFSYVIPLNELKNVNNQYGFIGYLIRKILDSTLVNAKFSSLKRAKYVELWAVGIAKINIHIYL